MSYLNRERDPKIPEYEIFLTKEAAEILEDTKDVFYNLVSYLYRPLTGFLGEHSHRDIYDQYAEGKGILLNESHMEDFVDKLNENVVGLADTYGLFKDWNFPMGEEYFIRHVEIEQYIARNYLLLKDFPERFNFVVDKNGKIVPISRWIEYNFGIENNGKIYLVKEYDTSDVLEKIIPFIRIKKLPGYKSHLHFQFGFGGGADDGEWSQTYLLSQKGLADNIVSEDLME